MLEIKKRNSISLFLLKAFFSCSLFSLAHSLAAQDDSLNAIDEQQSPPPEEEISDEDPEQQNNYFLNKSDFERLEVQQRNVPDSVIKKLKEDKAFWYADYNFKSKEKRPENINRYVPMSEQTWFQTLLWLLIIGGFAAAIIWYLADSRIGLFRKKSTNVTYDDGGVMPEDIFAINYQKEIDKATAQNDFRLAVRLMFLRLLKSMSERNIIQYKQDKTNFDYLLQLLPTAFYKDFFRITRNYEYSWYGKFDVSEEAYKIIKSEFDHFESKLK